jgi:STAS domain
MSGTPRPARSVRAPGFVLTSRAERGVDRIGVAGDLTMATAALLDAEVIGLYGSRGRTAPDLVLDLTDVTFLDVMGVAALRRIHEQALRQGGIRLGLPIAEGPRRLIALALDRGWLPSAFHPTMPTF